MQRAVLIILFIAGFIAYLVSCQKEGAGPKSVENTFAGSTSCMSCHAEETRDWLGSHHDWAMKYPSDSTVLGNFNDVEVTLDGVRYKFERTDSSFWVTSTEINGATEKYEIAYTFGVYPLQQYLVKFPDGKYQTLRVTWDSEKGGWFHQYADERIPPDDWLHWSEGGQRWNTMCAECHSTDLHKNYDVATDVFNTTYREVNVGCEACHGKGSAHIRWAGNPNRTGDSRILVPGYTQQDQVAQCAPCHSRRTKITEVFYPEVSFDEQYIIQTINDEYYFPDGQILEEDYVMGSFMQSVMYHEDVKCSDCHNSHSLELKAIGNDLCLQCHEKSYAAVDHHFHEIGTESAECISCHMRGRYYMGNDFRRDHSFRVPRPDQSLVYGTPNACTGCHTDKSDQWAADMVVEWYGEERPHHFSDVLLKASERPMTDPERAAIYEFVSNSQEPAIARATAIEYLPLLGSRAEASAYGQTIKDSSARVRYATLNKFMDFPPEQRSAIGMNHLADSSKMVRIAAARLMLERDTADVPFESRADFVAARQELLDMLMVNADFPIGRLQLGDYYVRTGDLQRAVTHYEAATKMDSLLTQVYSNLATAYNLIGNNAKALSTLDRLIGLEPEYAFGYYLRGLLNHEMGFVDQAIADLEEASQLDTSNFRYLYNLTNMQFQDGRFREARRNADRLLALAPQSEEARYLKQLISAELQ